MSTSTTPDFEAGGGDLHDNRGDVPAIAPVPFLRGVLPELLDVDATGGRLGERDDGRRLFSVLQPGRHGRDGSDTDRQHIEPGDVIQQGRLPRADPAEDRHFETRLFQPVHNHLEGGAILDESPAADDLLERRERLHTCPGRVQTGEPSREVAAETLAEVGADAFQQPRQIVLDSCDRRLAGGIERAVAGQPLRPHVVHGNLKVHQVRLEGPAHARRADFERNAQVIEMCEHRGTDPREVILDDAALRGRDVLHRLQEGRGRSALDKKRFQLRHLLVNAEKAVEDVATVVLTELRHRPC